jgi:hypothetical protein
MNRRGGPKGLLFDCLLMNEINNKDILLFIVFLLVGGRGEVRIMLIFI